MVELGVMGGRFSPVHLSHLLLADWAYWQHSLSKVLFIPSGTAPHKQTDDIGREGRFDLLCAGIAGHPGFEASRIEIDRPGVSWTIDTLQELKKQHGDGTRLNFLMGEDNIASMEAYDRREEFCKLCRLLIAPRGNAADGETPDEAKLLAAWQARLPFATIGVISCPVTSLSSSLVRKLIDQGKPYRYLVPTGVFDMIEARGYYKAKPVSAETPKETAPVAGSEKQPETACLPTSPAGETKEAPK